MKALSIKVLTTQQQQSHQLLVVGAAVRHPAAEGHGAGGKAGHAVGEHQLRL